MWGRFKRLIPDRLIDTARDSATRVLHDLHTLEVNTLQNDAMTAERMPPLPTALARLAEEYLDWLTLNDVTVKLEDGVRRSRSQEFQALRDIAHNELADARTQNNARRVMLQRIYRNCIYLASLCESASGNDRARHYLEDVSLDSLYAVPDEILEKVWNLPFADRAKVRKIWEVGTERVLIQSTIQLEGDVVTRFSQQVFTAEQQHILAIHQQAIKTSTRMWSVLIDTVGALAGLKTGPSKPEG